MSKKHSHEYVFNYYKGHNYEMTSVYKNCMTKDKLMCPLGHEIEMTFNNFNSGHRCKLCNNDIISKNKTFSQQYVIDEFLKENYILLSEYKSVTDRLNIICSNGHKNKITFRDFRSGNRCSICAKTKKYEQNEVVEIFNKFDYIVIGKYKNNNSKLEVICPNKHNIQIRLSDFMSGVRCKKCFIDKHSGESHFRWNPDRTRKIRIKYLALRPNKIYILKDDPLYEDYIQSQKEAKLSGKDWNKTEYNVDHIFPRKAFIDNGLDIKFDKKIIKEICNSRDNLRILSSQSNKRKSGEYNQQVFMDWFNKKIDYYL